jgi:hypothetical protein
VTTPRVTVPVPAETGVEDRLAGSLTFRHAAYLAVAAAGAAVMLLGERSPVRVVLGAPVAVIGVAGALVRPYGEPLDRLVPAACAYLQRKRREGLAVEPVAEDVAISEAPVQAGPATQPTSTTTVRRVPIRPLLAVAGFAAVVAVAVVRWPQEPASPPPVRQVVVVPVPVADPWEEAIDDAVDSWVDDVFGP